MQSGFLLTKVTDLCLKVPRFKEREEFHKKQKKVSAFSTFGTTFGKAGRLVAKRTSRTFNTINPTIVFQASCRIDDW